jgi:4-hydroxy-2-oxoheptanedioate aldolase
MRMSTTLAKIRAGKPVKVGMMGFFIPLYVAHAAANGYDAIWLDLEHRPMEAREIQALLAFCHLYNIDCIIRSPTREKGQLYRYLEDGAAGLIIPLIEDEAQARDIVSKVKFPPLGDRGLEGRGLDGNFGLDNTTPEARAAFIQHANRETILILQLESPASVRNAESIATVPGVDMLFVGPTDYEIRLPQAENPISFIESLDIVAEVCRKHGKAWGAMPRTIEHVKEYTEKGAQFVPWGIDAILLSNGLKACAAQLAELYDR